MALDYPDHVRKIAVLDMVPTRTIYSATNQRIATDYDHGFFLDVLAAWRERATDVRDQAFDRLPPA